MLAKTFLLKVIQAVIFSINTDEKYMISVGNENKKIRNEDRCNYCHHMPMLPVVGANHRLPLLNMAKTFICLNETKKRINEFAVVYMINPGFNVNKFFRDQVEKCMYTTFDEITQPFIKSTFSKNDTSVLE